MTHLNIARLSRRLRQVFTISRGSKTHAETIVVTLTRDGFVGRGECVPYARYGEDLDTVTAQIEACRSDIENGIDRPSLMARMPAGAARNAVDCALWDLEAKISGRRANQLAGLPDPEPVLTAYTLSVDSPEAMAVAARQAADRPLLKLKAGGEGDLERVAAVREAVPEARLIVDANEAWEANTVQQKLAALASLGVEMVEQPLPAADDGALREVESPICLCADESFHDGSSLSAVVGKYEMVNIKLDKTGGLTEALAAIRAARELELKVMVGCMVAGSLAMAPAVLAAQGAEIVDLDGPLLLAEDDATPLTYSGSFVQPPAKDLWG